MRSRWTQLACRAVLAMLGGQLVVPSIASAEIVSVGYDQSCTFDDLQAAIDHLELAGNGEDYHEIRIAYLAPQNPAPQESDYQPVEYDRMAVEINDARIALKGGYATCWEAGLNGGPEVYEFNKPAVLNGFGAPAGPVIRIRGNAEVSLQSLIVKFGNNLAGDGGAVDFEGAGRLTLQHVRLSDNAARRGGAISAKGTGFLVVDAKIDTVIVNNEVLADGGGVFLSGDVEFYMIEADSSIIDNKAPSGFGGGIAMEGGIVRVGSTGIPGRGVLDRNTARDGGAVSIRAVGSHAPQFYAYTTNSDRAVKIIDNVATGWGGAFYTESTNHNLNVDLHQFVVANNRADQDGAIVFATGNFATGFYLGREARERLKSCTNELACNAFRDNVSTQGALFNFEVLGFISGNALSFVNNTGHSLFYYRTTSQGCGVQLRNTLIVRNVLTAGSILSCEPNSEQIISNVKIVDSTIADNTLGQFVFDSGRPNVKYVIAESIVHQPGLPIIGGLLLTKETYNNIVSDIDSMNPGDGSIVAPPRFVDPDIGDYSLRLASAAVDYSTGVGAPVSPPQTIDRVLTPRTRDIALKQNRDGGVRDVGAFELNKDDIVTNGSFDGDARGWKLLPGGGSSLSLNSADSAGAGEYNQTGKRSVAGTRYSTDKLIDVATQCVHLPSAGFYALYALARTSGEEQDGYDDIPVVKWRLRANSEDCSGAFEQGELHFPAGDGWRQANPGVIEVSSSAAANNPTVELILQIRRNPAQPAGSGILHAKFDRFSLAHSPTRPALNFPPAPQGDTYRGVKNTTLLVDSPAQGVLANDTDPDGPVATVELTDDTPAAAGSLSLNPDGTFSYIPPLDFEGQVNFTYRVFDGYNYSNPATVTIEIAAKGIGPIFGSGFE